MSVEKDSLHPRYSDDDCGNFSDSDDDDDANDDDDYDEDSSFDDASDLRRIPNEVLEQILSHLQPHEICRAASVCRCCQSFFCRCDGMLVRMR